MLAGGRKEGWEGLVLSGPGWWCQAWESFTLQGCLSWWHSSASASCPQALVYKKAFVGAGGGGETLEGKMAVSLCDKQNCGRPRAGGQGQRKAPISSISSLYRQRLWWWVGSEAAAPTLWEMKLNLLHLPRLFQATG